jgi:hypothetical protein
MVGGLSSSERRVRNLLRRRDLRPLRWPCVFSLLFTPSRCGQRRSGQVGSQDSASARTPTFLFMKARCIAAPPSARFLSAISWGPPLAQPATPSLQIRLTSALSACLPRQTGAPRAVVSAQARPEPLRSLNQGIQHRRSCITAHLLSRLEACPSRYLFVLFAAIRAAICCARACSRCTQYRASAS